MRNANVSWAKFAVAHHHIGLEMTFRRTHAREIDTVACAPVVFAQIQQMACHHCNIGAPVLKTYQHTHADFVHSGLPHAVESVDTPFKVRFHTLPGGMFCTSRGGRFPESRPRR